MANKKNTIILTTLIASIICCICYICICLSILIFDHTTYSGCRHKGNSPDNYYDCPVGEEKDCDKYCDKIKDGTECNNNKMCHYRSSFYELIKDSIKDTITKHGEVNYCMLLDIDGKWYFDKYIKSKKECDNKKNGFWCNSMNPKTTTDEICQVNHGINDSVDEMICPMINIDTDCTGVDEPYPGCNRQFCEGSIGEDSQKPYPGCDCTADMMDNGTPKPETGCYSAKCTDIDLPYPGCIESDCVGVDDPYSGCKEQKCEMIQGTNNLSYQEPYVGCIRNACTSENTPLGCDRTCKAAAEFCPTGWELNHTQRDTPVNNSDGVPRMTVRNDANSGNFVTDFRAAQDGSGDDVSLCCTPIPILDSTTEITTNNMVASGIPGSTTDGLNGIGELTCKPGYSGKPIVEVTRDTTLTLSGCAESVCTPLTTQEINSANITVSDPAGTTVDDLGTVLCAPGFGGSPAYTCTGGTFSLSGSCAPNAEVQCVTPLASALQGYNMRDVPRNQDHAQSSFSVTGIKCTDNSPAEAHACTGCTTGQPCYYTVTGCTPDGNATS